MPNRELYHLRKNYQKGSLTPENASEDPFVQFDLWYLKASEKITDHEPNAMVLSTCGSDGQPSNRVVLLKKYSKQDGLVFFTNYLSRKGKQIDQNNKASVLFFWPELERQVRVEGVVSKIKPEASDEYFDSRPAESRASAIASPQSTVVEEGYMDNRLHEVKNQRELKRPEHWGGYALQPNYFEFWQGKPNRMHDRLRYCTDEDDNWVIERLAP